MYMKKKKNKNKVRPNLTLFLIYYVIFIFRLIYSITCESTFPMDSLITTEAFVS